jgi:Arc/MetJ-type ribon-helix-helix transcriptional regulator
MSPKIIVELNQQQEELIDRLVEEGDYGSTPGEVIANLFRRFRLEHPEVLEDVRSPTGNRQ